MNKFNLFFSQLMEKQELSIARGINRKHLMQIPDTARVKPFKVGYSPKTKTTRPLVHVAKTIPSGVWKITYAQIIDMANKYHFDIPTKNDPKKFLGTTGIAAIFKDGNYFLVKRQV